jgi:RNA polymerase sigma-70 factor (ECF subfamily)
VKQKASTPLIAAYFTRRDELKRFFAARFGSTEQAEDLVQDLYLKVAGLDGAEANISNPGGYLYRLAMNLMLDHVRQRSRTVARDSAWRDVTHSQVGGDDVAEAPDIEAALTARKRLAILLAAVDALPPPADAVFRLHKFEGLTHAQTAARLGLSQRMVEKHVSGALKVLLAKIGGSHESK